MTFTNNSKEEFSFLRDFALSCGSTVVTPVRDHRDSLVGDEYKYYLRKKGAAGESFSSGRYCVRLLQRDLGLPEKQVIPGPYGPIWPDNCTGSITHSAQWAAAVIVSKNKSGMGIDIEKIGRVKERVGYRIATEEEASRYSCLKSFDWTLLFSAKEAIFKSFNSISRRSLGFREIDVVFDFNKQVFEARYAGLYDVGRRFGTSYGLWATWEDHLVTLFVIN